LKSSVWKVVDQFRGPKCGRYSKKVWLIYWFLFASPTIFFLWMQWIYHKFIFTFQGLFPYDLFVKLYNSSKAEMRPCGLINCGNRYAICFFSSESRLK
jgi:ubiquitin carboxyl-terminal hydrolase 36/42